MNVQADISSSLAAGTQGLDKLRAQAKQSPAQALKGVAQQFESVFLNMMLKSMRDATPQDGMFDSEQTKMFTGMLDQQLAQNMSTRGVGLADIIAKQLSKSVGTGTAATTPKLPTSILGSTPNIPTIPTSLKTTANAIPSAYSESFQQGFVQRTPRGRVLASAAYGHLGLKPPAMPAQTGLFSDEDE